MESHSQRFQGNDFAASVVLGAHCLVSHCDDIFGPRGRRGAMAVRADEVLRRIDFETKKSEVDELLQKIDTNGSRIHRNNLRRVAHCHNELIIMDLEDAVAQAGDMSFRRVWCKSCRH